MKRGKLQFLVFWILSFGMLSMKNPQHKTKKLSRNVKNVAKHSANTKLKDDSLEKNVNSEVNNQVEVDSQIDIAGLKSAYQGLKETLKENRATKIKIKAQLQAAKTKLTNSSKGENIELKIKLDETENKLKILIEAENKIKTLMKNKEDEIASYKEVINKNLNDKHLNEEVVQNLKNQLVDLTNSLFVVNGELNKSEGALLISEKKNGEIETRYQTSVRKVAELSSELKTIQDKKQELTDLLLDQKKQTFILSLNLNAVLGKVDTISQLLATSSTIFNNLYRMLILQECKPLDAVFILVDLANKGYDFCSYGCFVPLVVDFDHDYLKKDEMPTVLLDVLEHNLGRKHNKTLSIIKIVKDENRVKLVRYCKKSNLPSASNVAGSIFESSSDFYLT